MKLFDSVDFDQHEVSPVSAWRFKGSAAWVTTCADIYMKPGPSCS